MPSQEQSATESVTQQPAMRLSGRCAVVTGASSGIGRAIARRLAREGATVVVSDIREQPLPNRLDKATDATRPTAEVITADGGAGVFVTADVREEADIDLLVATAVDRFGRLDIIVNNATGASMDKRALDTTLEEWDEMHAVTLRGVFLCCRSAIAQMITQAERNEVRGRVINIASQYGLVGPPEDCAYAAAKGGVVNLTRQLAVGYGRQGIIVNSVAPGRIVTGTGEHDDDLAHPSFRHALNRTPFPRLGRPDDVASAVTFLASDDCSFISGITLMVDGGWTAY
jgi:glucose 1-dehydrogenase